jgi:hypothetical protein
MGGSVNNSLLELLVPQATSKAAVALHPSKARKARRAGNLSLFVVLIMRRFLSSSLIEVTQLDFSINLIRISSE